MRAPAERRADRGLVDRVTEARVGLPDLVPGVQRASVFPRPFEDADGRVAAGQARVAELEACWECNGSGNYDTGGYGPDGEPVEAALRDAVAAAYDLVVTSSSAFAAVRFQTATSCPASSRWPA